MLGAYTPLTKEGNIMVDGVLASCYASHNHDLAHTVMTPTLWFPDIMEWVFGNKNGYSVYSDVLIDIKRLAMP